MNLDSKIPDGPLSDKWENHRFSSKLVNPANKRKFKIIVVGSGLAGYFGWILGADFPLYTKKVLTQIKLGTYFKS